MNDACPVLPATGATWTATIALAVVAIIAGGAALAFARRRSATVAVVLVLAIATFGVAGSDRASAAADCPPTTTTVPVTTTSVPVTTVPTTEAPTTTAGPTTSTTEAPPPPPPILSVADVEVGESSGPATVVITRTGEWPTDITVDVTTTDGTATAADYSTLATSVTIPGGGASATVEVDVEITPDFAVEPDEDLTVTATPSVVVDPASDLEGTVTILDDDTAPVLTIGDVTVDEGAGTATLTVTRSGAGRELRFSAATAADTARAGSDFTAIGTDFTIPASGDPTATIAVTVPLLDDELFEQTEVFDVQLTLSSGDISPSSVLEAAVTIADDDPTPFLIISDVSVLENAPFIDVVVTRHGATSENLAFQVITTDGTATSSGVVPGASDFSPTNATATISMGSAAESITMRIGIYDDSVFEDSEQFSAAVAMQFGTISVADSDLNATVTINNDDAQPVVSVADVSVSEGGGTASVTIALSGSADTPVSVQYASGDVTAIGTSDYVPVSGTITFPASFSMTQTITLNVPIVTDAVFEMVEQFTVSLTPVSGPLGSGGDLSAVVTIINDDPAPTITVSDVTVSESGGTVDVTVRRIGGTVDPIALQLSTLGGTAIAGSDFVAHVVNVTFPPSAGDEMAIVRTVIVEDAVAEPSETFTVHATPVGGTINGTSDVNGVVTIIDDD